MQPGACGPQPQRAGAVALGRVLERLEPLAIGPAHAPQVPLVVAAEHEVREHRLVEPRRVHLAGAAHGHELVLEVARHDHEAEPQRREERLAEAAEVDDAAVGVEAVQARDRPGAVAELAVVVVLDDPRARGAAQRSSASRRGRLIGTPSGNWCDGVT